MEVCECTSKQAQSSQGLRFWVSTNVIAGVKLRLPVLADSDVRDVQEFAVKNRMDFVAISFVQCVDDVRYGVVTCVRHVQEGRGGAAQSRLSFSSSAFGGMSVASAGMHAF